MSEWQSVDTQPPESDDYLVAYNPFIPGTPHAHLFLTVLAWNKEYGVWLNDDGDEKSAVTHWMKLPEPPPWTPT